MRAGGISFDPEDREGKREEGWEKEEREGMKVREREKEKRLPRQHEHSSSCSTVPHYLCVQTLRSTSHHAWGEMRDNSLPFSQVKKLRLQMAQGQGYIVRGRA